ncbi:hypothetical protein D9M71_769730 [compost metagenome]
MNEAAVDLDDIDRKLLQVTERGIAGAEVVHGQGQAQLLELVELAVGVFGGFEQQAFGQLQLQQMGRQRFFLEDIGDRGNQLGIGKLLG